MKRRIFYILAAAVILLVTFILILAYHCFPQDQVVFDDKQYTLIEDFDIRVNGSERVHYKELPCNYSLGHQDTVTMTTTLKEPYVAGAVLFFRTGDVSVSVTVAGHKVYEFGEGKRIFGRSPFHVWHFAELPEDYVGKEVVITQKQQLYPVMVPNTLYPARLSTKATALVRYFFPTYGFILFLAVTMAVVSLGFLIFSLILIKNDKSAIRIFYFFLIYLHISIWGICNNLMITLFLGNSYFIYCLHYIMHASLIIPIMMYFGECYRQKYKKVFHNIILFDLIKLLLLIVSELLTIRTLTENIYIIDAVLAGEIIVVVSVIIYELIRKNKENRNIAWGLFCIAFIGLFEIVRFFVFHKTTITNGLYYGMAVMLTAGAIEVVRNYFKEAEDLNRLKTQNKETLRLLDIQQGYYERISAQLHTAKQAAHDFNHYNSIIYGVIQSGNTEKLKQLLEKTNDIYRNIQMNLYTECLEINSILNFAAETCAVRNIKFTPNVRELDVGVNLYDLCIIIGNMVDNAVEGASAAEGERFITFFTNRQEGKLFIGTENSYSGNISVAEGKVKTTKQDKENHGLGLLIIEEILKKYNGELWMEGEGRVFKALAMIPKKEG